MSISLTLAWRYLWGRRLRTVLTTLAIVFGVTLLFGLNGMLPAITESFQRNILATAGKVDISVTNTSGASFSADVADKIRRVPGVGAVSPTLRRTLSLPKGGPVTSVTVVGVDPTSATKVRSFPVKAGRFLVPSDSGVVAIGADLAERLNLHVGSQMSLPAVGGTHRYEVVGLLNTVAVPGAEEVFMTLPDAQLLFGEGNRVNEIEASLAPGADRNSTQHAVTLAVGSDYTIGGLGSGTELLASLKVGQFAINMFGVFALIMAGFIILNTFRTVVAERRHDIGMLRAIGARRQTIMMMFLVESLIQGVVGTAIGIFLGYGLATGLVAAMTPLFRGMLNMEIGGPVFGPSVWIVAIVMGVGTTLVGALSPALAASRVTPLEALRPKVAEVESHERGIRAFIGVGLLVASLVGLFSRNAAAAGIGAAGFLTGLVLIAPEVVVPVSSLFAKVLDFVFPTEAELARSNMQRQPSRAATTAAAVMVSLAIVIGMLGVITSIFSGFMAYVDKSLGGADFVVLPSALLLGGGNPGASAGLVGEINQTPGVSDVTTLRIGKGTVNGSAVQVVGIDPAEYPKIATFEFSYGGKTADISKLKQGRTLIANGVYAAQKGVRPGDTINLATANGVKPYKVVAVGSDYLNAKLLTVYTSQENLAQDFGVESNAAVLVSTTRGASVARVKADLSRLLRDYPQFALYDTKTFRDLQLKTFGQTISVFYLMLGVLALPSLLALLNTLAISVLARTREIGMIRAVGSTRRQIRSMVLAESLLLASIGVILGLFGGVVLGYALVLAMNSAGFAMPYFFPTAGIVTAIIIGFSFAMLAAVIPARNASKLDIVAALHYE